ncbi:FAD-linked oxidase C-terminal domain-containing protein [Lutibaculum baratangense]|uniref:D-lactate dehydrogenase (cytochrome) n=1 Tax=Lutibaculum baratangense AMV1 TaxID=631454 RepID=V4RWB5_9HYPH|nr:FAD-linked oxidase C-terminal domain-containing protein [Lutibaculum baratangense]ESR27310.1 D-Lactate dehydrogenase, cytochrome c-dependent [Lutibaculum baratangense AMV1]
MNEAARVTGRLAPDQGARDAALSALASRFGDRMSTSAAVREQHGHTTTWHANMPPDAVVYARSEDEVAEIVRICAGHGMPVIPFGTGTSLEGQVNAPFGGVSIDMSQMNRILAVHPEDLDCVVEPGVTRKALNEYLRDQGLFFPIDPGANASIGGMASTRASGTNAVRYGTMKDAVLSLRAVMPDGRVIRTGTRARKSSAGYDLTRLMVGAEGTLGVITELTLRLHGIPEAISAGVCQFETLEGACSAVVATIQSGIPVARIELLDELQVRASNAYSKLTLQEKPSLFVEFHGSEAGVREQAELFGAIAAEFGGGEFAWAREQEARNRLWQARHDAYWACVALRPGAKAIATDVCVPISRLAECIMKSREDLDRANLLGPIVGHVGDGNFHVSLLVDMTDSAEVEAAGGFMSRLVDRAIEMGGTCTGEHGVGHGKTKYLAKELGEAVDVMRAVKQAIDPGCIMNPGKIISPDEQSSLVREPT